MTKLAILLLYGISLYGAIATPSDLSITATETSATLTWKDVSSHERGYKIFRDGKFIKLLPANSTQYIDDGLTPHTSYRYEFRATDDVDSLINDIDAKISENNLILTIDGVLKQGSTPYFFLDTDNNPLTGYSRYDIKGADYLVQGRNIFKYGGIIDGKKWNWNIVASDAIADITTSRASFTIPLDSIPVKGILTYLGAVSSSDWNKHTYYSHMSEYQGGSKNGTPIFIIGSSTVYIAKESIGTVHYADESQCALYGWGELLPEFTKDSQLVYNYAQPGASGELFMAKPSDRNRGEQVLFGPNRDHYWAGIKKRMQEVGGGILLIQFGGNDARLLNLKYGAKDYNNDGVINNSDETLRVALIKKNYTDYLKFYADEAKKMNYTPVFVTTPSGRARDAEVGRLKYSREPFPTYMKELAVSEGIRVLDLNKKTVEVYESLTNEDFKTMFADCYNIWNPNHPRETTHFEKFGARRVAGWIKELACEEPNSQLCKQFK